MKKSYLFLMAMFAALHSVAQIPSNGLVGRYDFANTSDFYNDGSSSNYDLCEGGTVDIADGLTISDSAALFDGSSYAYYCGADGSAYLSNSASFSAWFKVDQFYTYNTIAVMRYDISSSPYNSLNLFTGSGANYRIACAVSNGAQLDYVMTGTTGLQLGQWYHAVCTYDEVSGAAKLYLNGALEASTSLTPTPIIYSNSNFTIGHVPTGAGINGFVGKIDEVLYYNRAITAEEVCEIFTDANCNLSPPAAPSNLMATLNGSNFVDLTWNDNASDEMGYTLERSDDNGMNFFASANLGAGITSYTDVSTSAGTTYHYRITAYNTYGTSAASNTEIITTATVGIDDNWNDMVKVVPNPSNGMFQIYLPETWNNAELLVTKVDGAILYCGKWNVFVGSSLAKGVYILKFYHDGNEVTKRIVVQ